MSDYEKLIKEAANLDVKSGSTLEKNMESVLNSFKINEEKGSKFAKVTTMPPKFANIDPKYQRNYNLADFKYDIIKEQVNEFQESLEDNEDVMVQLSTFGSGIIMSVETIRFQNSDLLFFIGTINGEKAQLIQHQSQLNFLLLSKKRENPNDKIKRIGFEPPKDNDE